MKILVLFLSLFAFGFLINPDNSTHKMTADEQELYDLITEYRKKKGLNSITINTDLNIVAHTHAQDLDENQPDKGNCNLHSWSNQGDWSPCCYTSDHAKASCMWDKPGELSDYSGVGYEIAHWSSAGVTPEGALNGWKRSSSHNEVVLNKGIWDEEWKAIGIGLQGNYAVVWFGNEEE